MRLVGGEGRDTFYVDKHDIIKDFNKYEDYIVYDHHIA